jgi:hypothetical protein
MAAFALAAEARVKLRLGAGLVLPADTGYREVYGKTAFLPRLEAELLFNGKLGAWISGAYQKKSGAGPDTGIACESAQFYLGAGASWRTELGEKLGLRVAAGPLLVSYRETAGPWKETGTALGADINLSLGWRVSSAIGIEARLGYLLASDSVAGESFKLGGAWGGLGLAIGL